MPNGAMVGNHITVYGREYTREVDNPAEPNDQYLVVRDVYRRHEVWQTGDRWGERQDWWVGFRVRTMVNGAPSGGYHFINTLGRRGHVGYYRVDELTYDSVPLGRYGRNVNRRPGDEFEDLDLDSLPDTDPELTD